MYACPDDADDTARAEVREKLARELESTIRPVVGSDDFRKSLPKPPEPSAVPAKEPLDGSGWFRAQGQPPGIVDKERRIYLPMSPARFSILNPQGVCVAEQVVREGLHAPGESTRISLAPFFAAIYAQCSFGFPAWFGTPV